MDRTSLFRNKGYWVSKLQIELYNQIREFMKLRGLNKTQLADHLGVTKGYVTQVLNGDYDHKLSKLVELSLAIDKFPEIRFVDLEETFPDFTNGVRRITWSGKFDGMSSAEETLAETNSGFNPVIPQMREVTSSTFL